MKVRLIEHTNNPLKLIYNSARQCYSSSFTTDNEEVSKEDMSLLVKEILASGHTSPSEHVSFTFAVEGVSRALTHQLVRHRIASYSQQSQRYVNEKEFDYIIPPSVTKHSKELEKEYTKIMKYINVKYKRLIDLGIPKEDARLLLPNACETKIYITMNARSLINFFADRCCKRAQWEIRAMANRMSKLCIDVLPEVFIKGGAKCFKTKTCPELERFACGMFPLA